MGRWDPVVLCVWVCVCCVWRSTTTLCGGEGEGVFVGSRGRDDTSFMFGVIMKNCAKRSFE